MYIHSFRMECGKLCLLILFCLITTLDVVNSTKNKQIVLNIFRQKSPFEQHLKNGYDLPEVINLFKKHGPRENDSISLYRFLDDQFYGKLAIGHPSQFLNVGFDTSWTLSWVVSSKCNPIKTFGCYFHNKYDHSKSSEYKKDGRPFSMNVGTYNLTGFYSYDNFTVAHSNVTAMSFVEIDYLPYKYLLEKADGIIGLGPKINDGYMPFFYKLYDQKKIKNPLFSIYLNRDTQSHRGGNIMLGFVDDKHIHKNRINNRTYPDKITFVNVDVGYSGWQFTLNKIIIDKKPKGARVVCERGCKAITNTGSNRMFGPKGDVDVIHDLIHATQFFFGRYLVDCNTVNILPHISFVINGRNFTLTGDDYTIKITYRAIALCVSAFTPSETSQDQDRWVLGGAFLSRFYSIYDIEKKKVGFVKAA